jgi:hypothetical protein
LKKVWPQEKPPIEIYSQNQAILAIVEKQPKNFFQNTGSDLNQFKDHLLPGQCRSTKERTPT